MSPQYLVVGAGIFGATTALALRRRGHEVTLLDPGPLPHPLAASTDVSKVVRMGYGPDEAYTELMEDALEGWHAWAQLWDTREMETLYHETGVLMTCRAPMAQGGFEHDSFQTLARRGHRLERLDAETLAARFPAWSTGKYVDGFFQPVGGYAESGRVVQWVIREAQAAGAVLREERMIGLEERRTRVVGVRTETGELVSADHVILATGAWAGTLLGFYHEIRATGHPVVHLVPDDPALFLPERFPVFTADVARTGLYGFPLNPDGAVKIALHDPGHTMDPDAPRLVTDDQIDRIRALLSETFPALADAPIAYSRLCLYADTQDGDLWIARHPDLEGLSVASGGSGHGFKFAPVLGDLIADIAEGKDHPLAPKFRWRPEVRLEKSQEAARYHGE